MEALTVAMWVQALSMCDVDSYQFVEGCPLAGPLVMAAPHCHHLHSPAALLE